MFKWRLLVEDGRKSGYTFSQPDLIIAATALLIVVALPAIRKKREEVFVEET